MNIGIHIRIVMKPMFNSTRALLPPTNIVWRRFWASCCPSILGSAISAVLPYFGLVLCHTFNILALISKKEQFKIPLCPYKITNALNAGRSEDKFEQNANFQLPYFRLFSVYIRANG